jgi:hypothetical protein
LEQVSKTFAALLRVQLTGNQSGGTNFLGAHMDIGSLLGIFIGWPSLALVPGAFFAVVFLRCKSATALLASLAWLAYFPYEQAMKLRILCTGECNIRVDLLLFYPVLLALSTLSLYALAQYVRRMHRARLRA